MLCYQISILNIVLSPKGYNYGFKKEPYDSHNDEEEINYITSFYGWLSTYNIKLIVHNPGISKQSLF